MELSNIFFPVTILISILTSSSEAINCYTCNSNNGTDKNCTDPFNPAYSVYQQTCMVPRKRHIGTFPANFCIKIVGISMETNVEIVIRACTLKNMDNQCGVFRYQNQYFDGCILTCTYDGCNRSTINQYSSMTFFAALLTLLTKFISNA